MPYSDGRRTACISSQVGCAMGCVFCATGQVSRSTFDNLTFELHIVATLFFFPSKAGIRGMLNWLLAVFIVRSGCVFTGACTGQFTRTLRHYAVCDVPCTFDVACKKSKSQTLVRHPCRRNAGHITSSPTQRKISAAENHTFNTSIYVYLSASAGCCFSTSPHTFWLDAVPEQMGFKRQLSSAEIFEQAYHFSQELNARGDRLSNVVRRRTLLKCHSCYLFFHACANSWSVTYLLNN